MANVEKLKQQQAKHHQNVGEKKVLARTGLSPTPADDRTLDELLYDDDTAVVINKASAMEGNRYRIDFKILAIHFLDASQRDLGGVMIPQYSLVGRMLGVDEINCRKWWSNKDEILRQESMLTDHVESMLRVKFNMVLIRAATELENRLIDQGKSDNMSNRDLINLIDRITNKSRLLSNKSTENVETHHKFITPIPDDAK